MRKVRARSSRDAARASQEGGDWGVFPALTTDVGPGRRVACRELRPARRANPKFLDRVFRPDASCIEITPLIITPG